MKVLLTGAFGNVGLSTLKELIELNYHVRAFDLKTKKNQRIMDKYKNIIDVVWGDLRNLNEILKVVKDIDVIIHLAAIIPPFSEQNPKLAYEVNVGGTKNLIKAANSLENKPKFIFTSSISVFGPQMNNPPPRKSDDPVISTDSYTEHKIKCEELVRNSKLPWTIVRLAAVMPLNFNMKLASMMFEIPLNQRIEIISVQDVGKAIANAVKANTLGKILLLGGGEDCRLYQREFIQKVFDSIGIRMIPETSFRIPKNNSEWFYTDWLDTEESQKLLNYQRTTFNDYLISLKRKFGFKRHLIRPLGPIIKYYLVKISPYYESQKSIYV
ncbi:MAG: NAD-dependent epimerase/dehydratase family protein [Candidatus Odinarchaeota archaeon]